MEIRRDLNHSKKVIIISLILISLILITHFVFILIFYASFEIALAQDTSNQVPSVTAKIGCQNATNIPTAYFDANGFPPNIQIGISLNNNNNNPNIQDPYIVLPDVPSHVLTDNSGSWSGQFNYYFSSGGDPSDNEGKYKYYVVIFKDENGDTKPDHPDMVAISPITC